MVAQRCTARDIWVEWVRGNRRLRSGRCQLDAQHAMSHRHGRHRWPNPLRNGRQGILELDDR